MFRKCIYTINNRVLLYSWYILNKKFLFYSWSFLYQENKNLTIILRTDIGVVAVVQTRKMKKKKHVED